MFDLLFFQIKMCKMFCFFIPIMQVAISKWHKGKDISEVLLQYILSIFPASMHQFYANILVFVNINPYLYTNDQFALKNVDLL